MRWNKVAGNVRRRKGFFIPLGILVLFILASCSLFWTPQIHGICVGFSYNVKFNANAGNDKLRILIWQNQPSKEWNFFAKAKTQIEECSVFCEILGDNEMADSADAILVLAISNEKLPKRRTSEENQIRVFYRQESPQGYSRYAHPYPNDYNWTMTYRRDSDVQIPYGFFKELSPEDKIRARKINHSLDFVQKKTRLVAWATSHCETSSRREELALELNKHVPVDVYGNCPDLFNSSFSCSTGRFAFNYKNCYAQLGGQYKFYLSFENSICVDYITEKLWEALRNDMVPIVYGGANYAELVPPGSYINTLDFPSVKMLAEHLKHLDANPEEYLKYFEWKKNYAVFGVNTWCALCEKLREHSEVRYDGRRVIRRNYSRIYPDILDWFQHAPRVFDVTGINESGQENQGKPACRVINNIRDVYSGFHSKSLLENRGVGLGDKKS